MYPSACIEWLFQDDCPNFADRIRAAKSAGLSHVEFHLWRDKPMDQVAHALRETGVTLTSFCVDPRRSLVDPAQHAEFIEAVRDSLAASQKVGSPPLIVASGFTREGVSHAEQRAAAIDALSNAAHLAEQAGVELLIEPLNTRIDHPGMFLHDTREALDIIEEVDSPNLKLLFDVYHSSVMDESLEDVLRGRMHLVRHVQIADLPGRNEPGTGQLDWDDVLRRLETLGYRQAIGLEYKPTLPSLQSLATVRQATGL
ncbi:hydroxypyruvate isomerase [Pseudomonas sp. SWI6]|uniref:TIM barrel protein n=1 Tax=Pseudomonas taiwanensis TaxID=470150 RepID=A0ABR6V3X9_9PSED|nr:MULTISPECIES: TIM barrel protein [Pseudomonas]AVD83583.1 hydroxypyruvate isomerase [Pseudomonas sp. SWI6]MBC3475203.1 TIM barrel protein [Pseudomonas taiwanensis]MBC3490185.1 TIM barrel protein [Pseudomonas taiwanensis]MDT8923131.1 TIM barrel protein [Pseudomonas taiwanensis]MPS99726.1 hydroxypyruvate isomerase [Pseudomonas sp.]